MPALIDISGQRFGRLIVIARANQRGQRPSWLCRCDCGKEITATSLHLRGGDTRSCGCFKRDRTSQTHTTHGATRAYQHTATYESWRGMRARCQYPKSNTYRYYGAKGIRVCDRWQSFANFLADMGERPEGMTLDRVNIDGDYEPGNCRWATPLEQTHNRRNSR
jgi:hypothetical protein